MDVLNVRRGDTGLILSEVRSFSLFYGSPEIVLVLTWNYSYSGFRSCISINPWDKRGTATAMDIILFFPEYIYSALWTTSDLKALTTSDKGACSRWKVHNFGNSD